jgi:hypothetical protein
MSESLKELRDRLAEEFAEFSFEESYPDAELNAMNERMKVAAKDMFSCGFDAATVHLAERLKEAESVIEWMYKKQAITIFIEDEGHVADFFARSREYLAKHKGE